MNAKHVVARRAISRDQKGEAIMYTNGDIRIEFPSGRVVQKRFVSMRPGTRYLSPLECWDAMIQGIPGLREV